MGREASTIVDVMVAIARECGRYGISANAMCPFAATRMTVNDAVIANWKRRVESGLLAQAEFEARMAMPGPEFVAPMVAYLCTDAAKDVNGQIFHAEKSHYHTYYYGEVARSIYKYENNGEFTVDELIKLIPASLMMESRTLLQRRSPGNSSRRRIWRSCRRRARGRSLLPVIRPSGHP